MKLIDFSGLPQRKKSYGGANGNKLSVILNDEMYMLKLPAHASKILIYHMQIHALVNI